MRTYTKPSFADRAKLFVIWFAVLYLIMLLASCSSMDRIAERQKAMMNNHKKDQAYLQNTGTNTYMRKMKLKRVQEARIIRDEQRKEMKRLRRQEIAKN
jgi:hypothetical protein